MKTERGSKREKEHGRYVRLPEYVLACPAWQSLDGNARSLYVELARRYRGPNSNNGKIPYSVREAAAALHIGRDTASHCFDALLDRGFIKIAKNSGFNVKGRISREWLLTEFPDDTAGCSNNATKDFMRWSAPAARPQNPNNSPITGTHSPISRTVVSLIPDTVAKRERLRP